MNVFNLLKILIKKMMIFYIIIELIMKNCKSILLKNVYIKQF